VQASLRRGVLRSLGREPTGLAAEIEATTSADAAIAAGRALPERASALLDDGADAVKVGREIGGGIDALTKRFLAIAIDELGEPPAPWAWLALGSEARMEQALHTDQDHALAYDAGDRPDDEVDPWFATLAERVTASLEASGIPRCTGDAMATTRLLRRSVRGWEEAFTSWMVDTGPEGSLMSSVVFDHRVLAGPLDIGAVIHAVVGEAPARYPGFIRHLAHRALDRKPPTGFTRGFVVESKGEHAGHLDIKHGGVAIVANIARCDAIRIGSPTTGTTERLDAATQAGILDDEAREAIEEAFRLLWQIRLEHQVRQQRAGEPSDDYVDPQALGPIQRLGLKEAFRVIAKQQEQLASELNIRR
jgi:CBS domain-containing protein